MKLSDGTEAGYDFTLHEDNDHAYGIWSNGETFYVVDADDDMVYTYHGVSGVVRPSVEDAETAAALVGNTGQSGAAGHDLGSTGAKRAQAFTTGTSRAGYALASVGIEFGEVSDTSSAPSDLEATLNADGGGVPGGALCTLIAPASLSERSVNTFAAPASGTTCPVLEKETTYFVVVERVRVTGSGAIAVSGTASGSEDTGAAEGWSIADGSAAYSSQAAAQGWASDAFSYKIEVRGSFINNPAAGEATVTGTAQVDETLTADTSGISDDDGLSNVSYSYLWIAGGLDIAGATGSSYTLTSNEQGKRIKVRVAFVDDRGNYETLTSEATPSVKAADRPGTVSLFPARPRAGTVVSARLSDPDGLEGGGSGPAASLGAVSWSWARSPDGNVWTRIEAYDDGDSYVPTEEDEGMLLRAEASYTDGRGPGKSAQAASSARVGAREPGPELTVTEIVTGLSHPWGIDFTPDGTMLFTQRAGVLNARLTDGAVKQVAADLSDLLVDGFAGLQALAVDPDFTTNRRFYTLQGHAGREMQVIAWTIDSDYDEATRVVDPLVKGMPIGPGPWHSGGRLLFGPEGYLWIATGDGRVVTGAQDLTSLGGKVLRVDPRTGAGAPGNPFGASSPVYAYGFRNPQGLALRPGTDQMWLVEHGPKHDDEINLLAPGGNYGWDPIPDDGALVFYDYSDEAGVPMTDLAKFPSARQARWSSGFPTLATSGAVFLDGSQWGEWEGRLAVATLKTKSLRVFEFTEQGDFAGQIVVPELDGSQGRLRTPALGPDGALYIATSNKPGVDRILRVAANRAATGAPGVNGAVQVGGTLTADVSGIADPDGLDDAAFSFQWVRSHHGSSSSDIEGATASTYTLVMADLGKTISVRVSFYDDWGTQETLASPRTVKVSVVACTAGEQAPAATAVEIEAVPAIVESTTEEYFVLYVRPDLDSEREFPVSVTLGEDGTTTLTEQLSPLPKEHYRVEKFLIADPADIDNDCIDDITELGDPVRMNPLNPARAVPFHDGAVAIPDRETFEALSYKGRDVPYHPRLQDLEFVKFYIIGVATDNMGIYFMNTETHRIHPDFGDAIGLWEDPLWGQGNMGGEIIYHPNVVAPDGSLGVYLYQFQPMDAYTFGHVARSYEVLAASMPLLDDNLAYYPMPRRALPLYHRERALYDDSRINVVLREDILPDVPFLPLNVGEGYGFLRLMSLEERPDPRDVAIYETIPNELSRVAGLITTVPQTPLSHVNLRAVQDGVPNAFIRDALDAGDIDDLIGRYVHYSVTADGYSIRAATPAEVEAHFAASRPPGTQTPERDLTVTRITGLDDIGFDDWNAFGVKAANVAVLRTLGFPDGTAPDGFAAPFYFYDEFMKHNGFYDDIEEMLEDPDFQSDYDTQEKELKKLRKKIKKGETPEWIIAALTEMHSKYPEGQSLRYRSSTNNEDLPGFSGAGLYDSKTQHPDETEEDGIAKSLKQVYASLWNFRAFTEREFYRVDHLAAAMGVLVHPNYSDELANGVAVSFDPIRMRYGSYYVNSQLGEDLVTNPDAHSAPEEILLHQGGEYTVLATSNQMQRGQLLMSDAQMDQLRRHLELVHDEFAKLYGVESDEPFAMEIEFKITSDDVLSIKQARPWVFGDDAPSENNPATGAPTISGTVQVNETLTADISGIADADGLTSLLYGSLYSYQWIRNDGTTETDIEDAASSTYTLSDADVGKTIRVRVSFTDDRGHEENLVSAATTAVQPRPNSPATGAPTISGTAQVGETLTADISGIADADGLTSVSYSYQWIANDASADTDISGQTGSTYTLVSADVGKTIRVRVGFTDDRGHEENLVSAATTAVQPRPNSPATGAPTISGTAQVGETLTVDTSGIADADGLDNVSYRYQWIANDGNSGTDIENATAETHTLTDDDTGKTIEVRVSFTDDRGNEETLTGAATTAVQPRPNSPATGVPTISGVAQVDQTLTVSTSSITDADGLDNVSYTYQWIANDGTADTDIENARSATYTPVTADQGKTIKVRVSFGDDANNSETLTSEATATVPTADEWWADMSVVDYGTGAIGAASADLFSNSGGNAGLQAKWLWYYSPERKLRLAFTENIPGVDDLTLQVGDVALALQPGDATYSWEDVDVDWEDGQTLTARIVHARASTVVVPNSPATGAPIIGGTAQAGETLTALTNGITDADGLTSPTYSYQWLAANVGIAGATNSTYTLTDADAGKTIKVRVSFTDDADHEETLTSAATTAVAARPNSPATGAPTISGTAQVGETLTADVSGVTDADGLTNVSFSYQWIRNDGNTDSDIESATSTTYNLVTADQGKTIKVRVSFTDRGGYQETLTSTTTIAVAARTSSDIIIVDVPGTVSLWPELPRVGTVVRATLIDPDGLEGAGSGAAASLGAVSWQWARSSEGSTWTSVDVYADGDSYTPTEDDEGMWLEVTAVYTDGHGQGKSAEAITAATVGAREASPELTVTALVTGLTHPWDIAFTPDGTMLFTERDHGLRVRLTDGTVRQVTADFSDLNFGGTAGLLALVLDPDFVSNRRFYTYQRHTGAEMQLIAWTIDEDYTTATRVADPLVGGIPVNLRHLGPSHGGGRLRFGPQGYLWVATGDGYSGTAAQDLSSLGGKVLRVDSQTGAGAPDNPFAPSPVYTYGHRNPQGLALRPGAGQMWSVEHGPDHDDEINLLISGGNYGWDPAPDEGAEDLYDETTTPMTDLVKFPDALQAKWSSGHPTLAVGGGVFLEGSQWREWEGQFAVATLKTRSVRVFKFTEEGDLVSQVVVPELDRTYGRLRSAVLGPDGALYITTTNGGGKDKILKVVPANTPATGAPTISGTAQVGETLTADTSGIADADGLDNVSYSYQWLAANVGIAGATNSTYTLSDEDEGKSIKVRVSFTDDADNAETRTSEATDTVAATKPGVPGHLNVFPHGTGALDVYWEAPASDGGSAITGYKVQWKESAGSWETPADVSEATVTGTTHTITGLTGGVEYTVRVSAVNDAGEGSPSAEASGTPQEAQIWSANLTVGIVAETFAGYTTFLPDSSVLGALSSDTITLDDASYTVKALGVLNGKLILSVMPKLTAGFVLVVGTEEFASTDASTLEGDSIIQFQWNDPGLDLPEGEEVAVRVTEPAENTPATGEPTITGTTQVGETLTADTSEIQDSNGRINVIFEYQWMVTDTEIDDATESTYTPSASDAGKTISVRVNFRDDAGYKESVTSQATEVVAATVPSAPQSMTVTSGSQTQELDVSWQAPSSNGGSAVTGYRVQWKESTDIWDTADDVSEATETGTTHTIRGLTGGVEYAVRVMASNDVGDGPASTEVKGTPAGGVSEQTVEPENSAPTGLPSISGTPQVDQTLTADTSNIDDEDGLANVSYRYQWGAGGSDIDGATGSTYTLTYSEQGQTIQVQVFFTDDADNAETLTSAATVAVAAAPNRGATGQPSISGTPQVGQTLTADTSNISDLDGITNPTFAYQWRGGGLTIIGATGSTYTLTASDQGKTITVRVRFTDDRNNIESRISNATAAVAAKPNTAPAGLPTISGTPQVGETLTADTSAIADDDGLTGVSYSYQWIANDGTTDTDIAGQTDSAYTLTDDDAGKAIRVRVSFTDDADNQEFLTSADTDTVAATKPGVPGRLNIFPHDAEALDVYWEAPASDGGSDITGYKVQWKDSADSWDTLADVSEATASGTIHTITGLTDGVEYSVRVLATNGVGDSPPSVEQTGTPRETKAPEMVRPRVDGATLKVLYDEALDQGSAPPTDSFDVRVACTCDDMTWLDEESKRAVESVSVDGGTVVLTLVSAATSEDVVVVSYTPPSDAAAARTRDLAGNAAAGFNSTEVFNDTDEPAESEENGEPEETTEGETPLTVSLEATTESHDGSSEFTFELRFSEEVKLSYVTLRDHAFNVTGGSVEKAQRTDKSSNIPWLITVKPQGNGDVTIELPATTDCNAEGAICTGDGRMLTNSLSFTVSGPGQ